MGKKRGFKKSKSGGSGSLVSRAKQMRREHDARAKQRGASQRQGQRAQQRQREVRRRNAFVPYARGDHILLVGEGNFSFARALARRFNGCANRLIATSYDTRAELLRKYPDFPAILEELDTAGVYVVHGVDGTALESHRGLRDAINTMMFADAGSRGVDFAPAGARLAQGSVDEPANTKNKPSRCASSDGDGGSGNDDSDSDNFSSSSSGSDDDDGSGGGGSGAQHGGSCSGNKRHLGVFDKVVFNFPHTGCGIKDTLENNRVHQRFLTDFFQSALRMLCDPATTTGVDETADAAQGHRRLIAAAAAAHDDDDASFPSSSAAATNVADGDIDFDLDANSGKGRGFPSISAANAARSKQQRQNKTSTAALSSATRRPLPQIHVTLKTGEPYNSWQVPRIAKLTGQLRLQTAIDFYPEMYSGYEHRRTVGAYRGRGATADADGKDGAGSGEGTTSTGGRFVPNKDIARAAKQTDGSIAARTYIFQPIVAGYEAERKRKRKVQQQQQQQQQHGKSKKAKMKARNQVFHKRKQGKRR